jgi:hypothetical protein
MALPQKKETAIIYYLAQYIDKLKENRQKDISLYLQAMRAHRWQAGEARYIDQMDAAGLCYICEQPLDGGNNDCDDDETRR